MLAWILGLAVAIAGQGKPAHGNELADVPQDVRAIGLSANNRTR